MSTQGGSGGGARKEVRFVTPPHSPLVQYTVTSKAKSKAKGKEEVNDGMNAEVVMIRQQEQKEEVERVGRDREEEKKGEDMDEEITPLTTQPDFIYM